MEDREELGLRAFKGIVCGRGGARYTSPRSTHARDRAGQDRTGRDGTGCRITHSNHVRFFELCFC